MKQLWNEGWSFLKTKADTEIGQIKDRMQDFEEVDLPHDWLIEDTCNLYEDGTGWYRKVFCADGWAGKRVALYFEGVYMDNTVYVNGQKVKEWKYGYSWFDADLTDFLREGENEVLVRVNFKSPNSRWYSGAGIYRDVFLTVTEKVYLPFHATYVSTKKQGEDFLLFLDTKVEGLAPKAEETPGGVSAEEVLVKYFLADESGQQVKLDFVEKTDKGTVYLVKKPALWDVDAPVLYTLTVRLVKAGNAQAEENILQEEWERIGFREVEFSPEKGFFLNGRHLKLNGVCEHHDLGALGSAFHKKAMRRKFALLKEMGVNAVRGTHNMMAPGFVELADEMGLLMISEAFDMWERPKTTYDYGRFFPDWYQKDVENWIKRDRNHPSVILWSIGNEIYDTHADEKGQEWTRILKAEAEKWDPNANARVTIGSNYMPWENAQACADIVKLAGYNYAEKYYEEHHEKHPDWMIYGSETSSIVQSRGIYHFPLKAGILSEDDMQCSALGNSITSWGAKSMESCIAIDRDAEYSLGQFLWTGFDYIGEPTPYHTKNSYFGQLDTAGFPKDSYYVWQSAWTDYREKPMIHVFPYWDFNEGQVIDLRVCSNAPWVELLINGRTLGRQRLTHEKGSGMHLIADYQAVYEKGTLCAVAYDEEGCEIAREEKQSFGNSHALRIKPESDTLEADGYDLLFAEIFVVDEEGIPVENACDRVTVKVTGAARLIGLDNGDSTDYDQYKGTSRRLFSGKLLAILQADTVCGDVVIEVSGKGLLPAAAVCKCVETKKEKQKKRAENRLCPIQTGTADEVPVRKIKLTAPEGCLFTKEKTTLTAVAEIMPEAATDRTLSFEAVNEKGTPSNLVSLKQDGARVELTALGDGEFYLRCKSKSGTDNVRIISVLPFKAEGIGVVYHDPYDFVYGSLYSSCKGEAGNGNEKGVSTARDGKTVLTYEKIDFGKVGSDEIDMHIFALSDEAHVIEIWEGIPGEEGSRLLKEAIYQKPSIWNVYQPESYRLAEKLTGLRTISFVTYQKMHIKGFSFTRYEKARMELRAADADAIYGDSFKRSDLEGAIEEIGNNVSLVFEEMDFGFEGASKLTICGRAPMQNTIQVRFANEDGESRQILEFVPAKEYEEQIFSLETVRGKNTVTFVFLPGSCFDFGWFRFE